MGTLLSQTEISVWLQALGALGGPWYYPGKIWQNPAIRCIFGVLKHFTNGNTVPPRNDPCRDNARLGLTPNKRAAQAAYCTELRYR